MTDDQKNPFFPSAADPDRQAAAERYLGLLTGDHRPLWHDVVGTERDKEPCGRFTYVAEKLIADEPLRARILLAMREIRSRCVEHDGKHGYRAARRAELPGDYLERLRAHLTGLDGTLGLASPRELVPRQDWMTDDQHASAFYQYWTVMQGTQNPTISRLPRAILFGTFQYAPIEQFFMPARGVLSGHLVHEPMMSDLAEFLAVAAGAAAQGDVEAAERAVRYLLDAAKTPPFVVRQKDRTHLVLICAD